MGARSLYPDYNYMFVDAAFDVFTRRDGIRHFWGDRNPAKLPRNYGAMCSRICVPSNRLHLIRI
jgi:hypothetical protein